jgi:hypothetical protein
MRRKPVGVSVEGNPASLVSTGTIQFDKTAGLRTSAGLMDPNCDRHHSRKATVFICCFMSFAIATTSLHTTGRRFTVTLMTAFALLLLSACGNTNPSSATPGIGQNQLLTWDTTTWDNSDWT